MANLCLAYFYLSEKCFIFLTSVSPYGNIDSHAGFGKVDPVIRSGWSWSGDPADRIRNIYKIPDQDRITKNYKNSDRITNFGLPADPEFHILLPIRIILPIRINIFFKFKFRIGSVTFANLPNPAPMWIIWSVSKFKFGCQKWKQSNTLSQSWSRFVLTFDILYGPELRSIGPAPVDQLLSCIRLDTVVTPI